MTNDSKEQTQHAGFTLIEILVVVALIAILGGLAVKPLNGLLQRIKLQNAAEGLKHQIMSARVRATANVMVHCGLVFIPKPKPTSDSILIFFDRSVPHNNTYEAGVDDLYQNPILYRSLDGIDLSIPTNFPKTIVFRGDGSANRSAMVLLTLGTFCDTVDVLASTGRIRVRSK